MIKYYYLVLFFLLVSVSVSDAAIKSASAKEIRDPFQVDFAVKEKGTATDEVSVEQSGFSLQGIILSGKKSVALIDDSIVGVGDKVYGWKVVGIKKDRVGLAKDGTVKRLYLNP